MTTNLEPYATLDAAGIPRNVLRDGWAQACERLEETAPPWATESDIFRKAGYYMDDRGTLEWEDEDMCEIEGPEMDAATQSNLRAIATTFGNVASIFDAAIKRERVKQAKHQTRPHNDDPPPERAA